MSTTVLDVSRSEALAAALARAAEVLRAGGLVAFPTETVYGLGANALDADAVARIFAAKGRPANNPLIVHVAETADVLRVASAWPDEAGRLAERFWPGPLTLVLPRRPELPDIVTAGGPTVAVRLPAHPVARELIRLAGVPIAAPSANRSNRLSSTRAEHVLRDLDGRIDLLLDGGPTPGGIESTVLDLSRRPPRLLRPGLIEPAVLEAVVGPIERPESSERRGSSAPGQARRLASLPSEVGSEAGAEALPSPGMLARHYAPRTPMELVAGGEERVRQLSQDGLRVGWLVWFDVEEVQPAGVTVVRLPSDAAGYAAGLYQSLHALDAIGLDRIVAALSPEGEEWLGVRDRLRRASG
jgi:L-threonylcarbamoyladenylate synthase